MNKIHTSRVVLLLLCFALVLTSFVGCGKDTNIELEDKPSNSDESDSNYDTSASLEDGESVSSDSALGDETGTENNGSSKKATASKNASSAKSNSSKKATSSKKTTSSKKATSSASNEVTVPENWDYDEEVAPKNPTNSVSSGAYADIYTSWPEGFSK